MSEFKIDKDVPIPKNYGRTKTIVEKMVIGDSIFCETTKEANLIHSAGRRIFGKGSMLMRRIENEYRVWRIV